MDHRTVEALARETAPTIDDTSSQLAIVRHHLRIAPAVAISYLFGCARYAAGAAPGVGTAMAYPTPLAAIGDVAVLTAVAGGVVAIWMRETGGRAGAPRLASFRASSPHRQARRRS